MFEAQAMTIDLNADVGEHDTEAARRLEAALFEVVSSANVACGFHAGNPDRMRHAVALARKAGVAVGAHPGFRDEGTFGRSPREVSPAAAEALVAYQVGALMAIARLEGAVVVHVKPHGALYNQAARDDGLAWAIARAVAGIDPSLALVALAGSALEAAGRTAGLRVVAEGFADRAYLDDGTLVPRDREGALIADPGVAAARAVRMARLGFVTSITGHEVRLRIDSLCVHGDTPGALELARVTRRALEHAGLTVAAPVR